MKRFAVIGCVPAALLLAGCASLAGGPFAPAPPAPPATAGTGAADRPAADPAGSAAPAPKASTQLLEQSRNERAAGNFAAAARSLDRAIAIAPDDAALWLEYAELEHAEGDDQQARVMARKAISLSGGDSAIASQAEQLLR